jgi:hypothetical protein
MVAHGGQWPASDLGAAAIVGGRIQEPEGFNNPNHAAR